MVAKTHRHTHIHTHVHKHINTYKQIQTYRYKHIQIYAHLRTHKWRQLSCVTSHGLFSYVVLIFRSIIRVLHFQSITFSAPGLSSDVLSCCLLTGQRVSLRGVLSVRLTSSRVHFHSDRHPADSASTAIVLVRSSVRQAACIVWRDRG